MKPGCLVVSNPLYLNHMRVYLDLECTVWDAYPRDQIGIVLKQLRNSYGLDVVEVLLPRGVRWAYQIDVVAA